ncbi:MAG: flavodoxin [Bacillota bacterium]
MQTAIVVYGTTTGNTEELATDITEELENSYEVTTKDVANTEVEELNKYDLIILGSSTWDAGELQEDFVPFYEELADANLNGKQGAVFGPGDTAYPDFCAAVDMLEERLSDLGVELLAEGFKWDGDLNSEATAEIKEWAQNL